MMDNRRFLRQLQPMNRLFRRLLLSLALVLPASAAPRFATVRISDIYQNLSSTAALQKDMLIEREEIMKDERVELLRKLVIELQTLQGEYEKKKGTPVDDEIRAMAQNFEQKRQEAQSLKEDFERFQNERNREMNRKMVKSMRDSLEKITSATNRIAKEQGFDAAFDNSGNSNSAVPVMLYSKTAKDITNDVVAALKDAGDPPIEKSATSPQSGKPPATPPAASGTEVPKP